MPPRAAASYDIAQQVRTNLIDCGATPLICNPFMRNLTFCKNCGGLGHGLALARIKAIKEISNNPYKPTKTIKKLTT